MPVLTELSLYPIKSCTGISLPRAVVTPFGLMSAGIRDREWMLVDANGQFLTQRECPAMARVVPQLRGDTLEVHAPDMAPLAISIAALPENSPASTVAIWDDTVTAYDCPESVSTWFSRALGTACRLVRCPPQSARAANVKWTGGSEVRTLFADGFPMLLISQASLADLNHRLTAQGRAALAMNRFRPNLVIDGVEAFEEDYAATLRIGDALLRPAKPCPRCPIPSIDQATGLVGPDPLDILQTYRANPLLDGAVTFGMNVYLLDGAGTMLEVGQECAVELAF
ncbi:MAG: MOSC N-terminal beta barrel domain-containing protein [Burkholderiaceae bacterium]|nr:MOSC N-terminal beta barrel domain-containing protein [Burkholderiaceae bacterium]